MKLAKKPNRHGAILIAVLVTMLVVTSIVGTAVVVSIRVQRESRIERQRIQIQFLCEAGAMRACEKIQADSTFVGDRWSPVLGDESEAVVEVTTNIVRDPGQQPSIEVTASLESGPYQQRVQRTKRFPFNPTMK